MKIIVAIFFCVLITVNKTPLVQLLKLPLLVEHFNKHNNREQVSILEFLEEHYTAGHSDEDQSEDNTLPYKSGFTFDNGQALMDTTVGIDFSYCYNVPAQTILPKLFLPQHQLFSVFHPPRT